MGVPPLGLSLVCSPPVRGDLWPELILGELERQVGQTLALEIGPEGRRLPARDRKELLGSLMFEGRWPEDRLILAESEQQQFLAFLWGLASSEACPEQGQDVVFHYLSVNALLPVAWTLPHGLEVLKRLMRLGVAAGVALGEHVYGLRLRGRYALPEPWPELLELTWLNGWSGAVAHAFGFPSPEDQNCLWCVEPVTDTGAYVCALTEERLDLSRPDHLEVYTWAARRFGVKNPRQS